jgi:DUF4097 and DUF4098 domain-containing protein YvlB
MIRILGFTGLLLLPFYSLAANEVQRTIDAASDGKVSISNTSGEIQVSGWSRNEVNVTADLGWGVEELVVERNKDEVTIKVKVPKDSGRNISSDLVVRVPENSAISVSAVSADVEISGVYGEQRLHSVSGDVSSEVYSADAEAESVSGDIELAGNGEATLTQLSTVSGDIEVLRLSGEVEATSVSGSLDIVDGSFKRAQGSTVNGDIAYRAGLIDGGKIDFETINGGVDLILTGDVSARFDIETFNGRIRNCFGPKAERSSQYGPGRELKFSEGSGSSRVTIRTLNGGMTLCRD